MTERKFNRHDEYIIDPKGWLDEGVRVTLNSEEGMGSIRIYRTAEPHSSLRLVASTRSRSLRLVRQVRRILY